MASHEAALMTTGTRVADERYSVPAANGGGGVYQATIGRYRYRTWNGGNAPSKYKGKKKPTQREPRQSVYPPNAYSVIWEEGHQALCLVREKGNANPFETTSSAGTFMTLPAADPKQIYKLTDKLRRKIYGTDWNPAVFLAEGRQAAAMVYNAAVRIGASIEAVRRRDWKTLKRALPGLDDKVVRRLARTNKDTSGLVLEVQYGWKPLLSDAEDGATWIAASLDKTRGIPARYAVKREWVENYLNKNSWGSDWLRFSFAEVRFKANVVAYVTKVAPPWLPSIATVASIFWEKLPYSFVGDWFVPIGSYLQAMRTASDLSGTFVTSVRREMKSSVVAYSPSRTNGGYVSNGTAEWTNGAFQRFVSTELLVPKPLSLSSPGEALSLERSINAVALMGQKAWGALYRELLQHPPTTSRLRP